VGFAILTVVTTHTSAACSVFEMLLLIDVENYKCLQMAMPNA